MKLWMAVIALATTTASADPIALPSTPMAGPFKSAKAACLAAPACGGTVFDEKTGAIGGPTGKPQCAYWPEVEPGDPPEAPAATTLASKGALLASVSCAAPRGLRHHEEQYYLFLKTAAGWWRAPVFSFNYNDKYCGEEITATWQTRGARRIARVRASIGCVACGKQGTQSDALDLMIIADPSQAAPVVYDPLITGQHERQERDSDGADDVACPTIKKDVVLATKWTDPHTLVLSGRATWKQTTRTTSGVLLQLGPGRGASSAGTYKLE